MGVSVVIVAKDEAHDIGACLRSVAWTEERLVVDTGSRDATMEAARAAGARVLEHAWGGYAATKNWAFAQTGGEWVLSLDADERVSDRLRDEIQAVTGSEARHAAYEMPRRVYFMGEWLKHGGCYPDWQLRLFRRGRASYGSELIHERLRVEGTIGRLRGHLDHYSYASEEEYLAKLEEYSSLWARQARAQGRRSRWYHPLSLVTGFAGRYVLKAGFLDGRAGLTWAALAARHSCTKYAKLAELQRCK
jgi:glycosyltransferase involved in cell wall biosynthesis